MAGKDRYLDTAALAKLRESVRYALAVTDEPAADTVTDLRVPAPREASALDLRVPAFHTASLGSPASHGGALAPTAASADERGVDTRVPPGVPEAGSLRVAPPAPDLTSTDESEFVRAARRHRLSWLLAPRSAELGLSEPAAMHLSRHAALARDTAVGQAEFTIRASRALLRAGVRNLVIDGVALAELTGSGLGSARPDVSIWVSSDNVDCAIRTLQAQGCTIRSATWPQTQRGQRYAQWATHRMTLDAPGQAVHLNWRLAPEADGLPSFDASWDDRQYTLAGGTRLPTLSSQTAFERVCARTMWEKWSCLGDLVALRALLAADRLQPALHRESSPAQRLSTALAAESVGLPTGIYCPSVPADTMARARRRAATAQRIASMSARSERTVKERARDLYLESAAVTSVSDAARLGSRAAFPPALLASTGRITEPTLRSAIADRARQAAARLRKP